MYRTLYSWRTPRSKWPSVGVRAIVVLGVDFMTENVRAVLDASGYAAVPVYRVTSKPIGCSLAEAADAAAYDAWLREGGSRASVAARRVHQHEPSV